MLDYLTEALAHAELGRCILPVWPRDGDTCGCGDVGCRSPGKHPVGPLCPRGLHDATSDPQVITRWWTEFPEAGIGMATGLRSNALVFDLDVRAGNDAQSWVATIGPIGKQIGEQLNFGTRMSATPSGGRHVFYNYVEGVASCRLGPAGEVKSDGSMVILPPSHDSLYFWVNPETPILDLSGRWTSFLRSLQGPAASCFGEPPTASVEQIAAALRAIPNDARGDFAGWMEWNTIAMATYVASYGSEQGFALFDEWSRRHPTYSADTTHRRWEALGRSPPSRIGFGSLAFWATKANPGWRGSERESGRSEKEVERERILDELAKLSRAEYEDRRKETAKAWGWRPSTLDSEVAKRRKVEDLLQPHWQVDPSPDPQNTEPLLNDLSAIIDRHVATLKERTIAVGLWLMLTWVHESAVHSPILLPTSPEPDSGKSTLAGLLTFLARNGLSTVEATGAVLFRSIEKWVPSIVLDEADALLANNDNLRAIVNSGWTRNQGVLRCDPETYEPRHYSTFCPKALVMKGLRLPATTLSRAILIKLARKKDDEHAEDFDHIDTPELAQLRSRLARWATDNKDVLRNRPEMPGGFNNRLRMNWYPLFAIAELAGEKVKKAAWKAARIIEAKPEGSASLGTRLLADIRSAFARHDENCILSRVLVAKLIADEESPWAEYRRGKPLSQKQLATLLREFAITSRDVHPSDVSFGHGRGYLKEQFEDVWARYLDVDGSQHPAASGDASDEESNADSENFSGDTGFQTAQPREAASDKGLGGFQSTRTGKAREDQNSENLNDFKSSRTCADRNGGKQEKNYEDPEARRERIRKRLADLAVDPDVRRAAIKKRMADLKRRYPNAPPSKWE